MADLLLQSVSKAFGSVVAVRDVTLQLPEGKLISFLGPSGCGKTTLLRLIAGLETPDQGRIFLGRRDITQEPTHQRNLGMVFQSLALFPHLTVGQNIAYGLRINGWGQTRQSQRVEELLELMDLSGTQHRSIAQLSGGQRQRVAIARALAHSPQLFLLDEPLSALDAKLREAMQRELRLLQQRLGITTILVTHDQREAMTMSDLVAVMNAGQVKQVNTPLDLYRQPVDAFVADFIGTSNLLRGVVENEREVVIEGVRFTGWQLEAGIHSGQTLTVSIRPEDITVIPGEQPGENQLSGNVAFVRDIGSSVEIYLNCGNTTLVSTTAPKDRPSVQQGDPAVIRFSAGDCVVLQGSV